MAKLFKITPLDKNSVLHYTRLTTPDGKSVTVKEWYEYGIGYRREEHFLSDLEVLFPGGILFDPDLGPGPGFVNCLKTEFTFSENISNEEQGNINLVWLEQKNLGKDWNVAEKGIIIYGAVQIDLIEDTTGNVIEKNVKPVEIPKLSNMPFDPKSLLRR